MDSPPRPTDETVERYPEEPSSSIRSTRRSTKGSSFRSSTERLQAGATADGRDRAVATEAIRELNLRNAEARKPAARLLVRADTVVRAKELAKLYLELDASVKLEVITHETTDTQLSAATARLISGESAGVAFVGVLGEGFDMPSLKIAAYHNPHRSLPVTIQFAGRVARTEHADRKHAGAG